MSDQQPLVTIVAVCYNQAHLVAETLDSIRNQTYPNIQLIIADDGSADGSKQAIESWIADNNSDAQFISHPVNLGLTRNINSAIPYIKGDYYQVFGCDDIMFPEKIEKQVRLLEENKLAGIVYSDMLLIDETGMQLDKTYYQRDAHKIPVSGYIYKNLIDVIFISTPSVLIRRTVLDELKYYNASLDYEDYDFFLRASRKFEFLYEESPTVRYRVYPNSMSAAGKKDIYFKNIFLIYYQHYDPNDRYKTDWLKKLLFATKNLYSLRFKYGAIYFTKAFLKTGKPVFLKFGLASIPFYFKGKK